MERERCQIAGCNEPAGLHPADVLLIPRTVSIDPGATRHLVPLCDQHRSEYDAGNLDLAARIEGLGAVTIRTVRRRCQKCGHEFETEQKTTVQDGRLVVVEGAFQHCPKCGHGPAEIIDEALQGSARS